MRNFLLGVASSLAAVALVRVSKWIYTQWRTKRIQRGFPVHTSEATIVIGGYPGIKGDWPDDLFVHAEAVHSAKYLSQLFLQYRTRHRYVVDREIPADQSSTFEICVGGPAINERTKEYLDSYCRTLYHTTDRTLNPNEAVIAKLTLEDKVVVLIFGNVAFDTICAVKYFCWKFDVLARGEFLIPNRALRLATNPGLREYNAAPIGWVEKSAFFPGVQPSRSSK
jgi:hypothetical protein